MNVVLIFLSGMIAGFLMGLVAARFLLSVLKARLDETLFQLRTLNREMNRGGPA